MPYSSLRKRAVIARAVESRRREFATARGMCPDGAGRAGQPRSRCSPGPGGAPQWPEGVVGSITHCAGYRAAAVALTRDVVSLGVDAEPNEALPDHGMLELIARDSEARPRLAKLAARHAEHLLGPAAVQRQGVCLQDVVSAYPALAGFRVGGYLHRRASTGTFTARLLVPGPSSVDRR